MNKFSLVALFLLTLVVGSSSFATTVDGPACPKPERRFTDFEHRGGLQSVEFECKSDDGCFKRCDLNQIRGARRVTDAQLVRLTSAAKCEEGVDWGWAISTIWVDHGCEGIFRVYTY